MLRALLVFMLVLFAAPAMAQEYQSKDLAEAGVNYRQELVSNIPSNKRQPSLIPRLRKDADEEYRAKRYPQAIEDLTRAIAYGADDGLVWLRLAQNLAATGDDHTMAAAYNAYVKSVDPVERANALFIIGRDYDRHDQLKDALAVFQAGLALTKASAVAERVEQLKQLVAFRVTKLDIQAEADAPRVCLRMNEKIAPKADLSYGAFVRTEPALDGIVTARGDTLCLDGLKRAAPRISRRQRRDDAEPVQGPHRHSRPQAGDQLCRCGLCVAPRGRRRAAGHDDQSRPRQGSAGAGQ